MDFVVVPNTNFVEKYGRTILDLYVGYNDKTLNRYSRLFYAFAVVDQAVFDELEDA